MRAKIKNILLFLFIFIIFFKVTTYTQNQTYKIDDNFLKELINKIQSLSESQFIDYLRANIKKIKAPLINYLAEEAFNKRDKIIFKIARSAADLLKNDLLSGNVYLFYGDYFFHTGDLDRAIKYYNDAEKYYLKANSLLGLANSWAKIGEIHAQKGYYEDATKWYNKALHVYEHEKDSIGQANIHFLYGEIFKIQGEYEQADNQYLKALNIFNEINNLSGCGSVLSNIAEIHRLIGNKSKAREYYEKAKTIFDTIDEPVGKGIVNLGLGEILRLEGSYTKAKELLEKALLYFQNANYPLGQGDVWQSLGEIYFSEGSIEKAIEFYRKAEQFYKGVNEPIGQGSLALRFGEILKQQGQHEEAIDSFNIALSFFEKVNYLYGLAEVWKNLGEIFSIEGENGKARENYKKAIDYFIKINDPVGQGNVLQALGESYRLTGENSNAKQAYEKALFLFEKTNKILGQGNVLYCLGEIFNKEGNYNQARKLYDSALSIYNYINEPIGIGNTLRSLGDLYKYEGDNPKAKEMYEKSIPWFEKAEELIGQGNAWYSLGEVFNHENDLMKAMLMFNKALPFYQKVKDSHGLGNIWLSIGEMESRVENNIKAKETYDSARRYFEIINNPVGLGRVFEGYGDIAANEKDYNNALNLFLFALDDFAKSKVILNLAWINYKLGNIYSILNKKEQALYHYESALNYFEQLRSNISSPDSKFYFFANKSDAISNIACFLIDNGYYKEAFEVTETSKARAFLDQIEESRSNIDDFIDPDIKSIKDDLIQQQSHYITKMQEATASANKTKIDYYNQQLQRISLDLDKIRLQIKSKNSKAGDVLFSKSIELDDLKENILKPDECILEYLITEKVSYCFVVKKQYFDVIRLDFQYDEFSKLTNKFWNWIQTNQPDLFFNIILKSKDLSYFYDALIKPIEKFVIDQKLIIIPDWRISFIPFDLLINTQTDKEQYLIEKNEIKYIQSSSVLGLLRKMKKPKSTGLLAFADPIFDYDNYKNGGTESEQILREINNSDFFSYIYSKQEKRFGLSLNRLFGTKVEVEGIDSLFRQHGEKSKIYEREEATETNAKSDEIKDYGYVHFSTHSYSSGSVQFLVMSQLPNSQDDGILTFKEIFNLKLNAELVTLSACQTGLGLLVPGEGIMGMTRAFMFAGADAVCVSLWNVYDPSTAKLMIDFYKNILDNKMEKSTALRQAKLIMINESRTKKIKHNWDNPYYWAPFIIYGD